MISIKTEAFTREFFAEVLPLTQKCWNESTIAKGETCAFYGERDFEIEPDVDAYEHLGNAGMLIIVTLRDDGVLKGYVIGFTHMSLHHKKMLCGFGDSIYLEPEYRSHTWALAKRFEKEMRDRGVGIIGWPVTPDGHVYNLLKATGYTGDDIVMEKRIRPCA